MISMSIGNDEIVVTLDAKRVVAITLLAVISIYTFYSYAIALFAFIAPYPNTYPIQVTAASITNDGTTYNLPPSSPLSFARGTSVAIEATVMRAEGYYNDYYHTSSTYWQSENAYSSSYPYYWNGDYWDSQLEFTVYITILDSNDKPVGFYTATHTFEPGEPHTFTHSESIGSGFATGVYTAKVLVWTGSLPDGESGTSIITEIDFTVT